MSARTLFVTGTDTGAGKTVVASTVLRQLAADGRRAVGFKPVASGCEMTPDGLRNDDAQALLAAGSVSCDYARLNPYAFAPAIAPHLAAEAAGTPVVIGTLDRAHAWLVQQGDWVIVEGAGGWAVPLNDDISFGGWVAQHNWPVLLVVGMRLGCINHAMLSVEAISRRGGWWAGSPAVLRAHGRVRRQSGVPEKNDRRAVLGRNPPRRGGQGVIGPVGPTATAGRSRRRRGAALSDLHQGAGRSSGFCGTRCSCPVS